MNEEKPMAFVLGIRPQFVGPQDAVLCYKVHAESRSLPKEIVLTVLRTWLEQQEKAYSEEFSTFNA